jgi:hypothetical protein
MKKNSVHIISFFVLCLSHIHVHAQVPLINSYSPAAATVYLDFDGAEVDGTIWNEEGKITAEPSGLSAASIIWIHKMIADHFKLFNLNITTDPAVYDRAPVHQRMRIIPRSMSPTRDSKWSPRGLPTRR